MVFSETQAESGSHSARHRFLIARSNNRRTRSCENGGGKDPIQISRAQCRFTSAGQLTGGDAPFSIPHIFEDPNNEICAFATGSKTSAAKFSTNTFETG
jgi:hypothetical protein